MFIHSLCNERTEFSLLYFDSEGTGRCWRGGNIRVSASSAPQTHPHTAWLHQFVWGYTRTVRPIILSPETVKFFLYKYEIRNKNKLLFYKP